MKEKIQHKFQCITSTKCIGWKSSMLIPQNLLIRTTNPENANCCHFKGKQSSKLMFSKDSTTICVYVFVSTKRKQNIFDHGSVFIFFICPH